MFVSNKLELMVMNKLLVTGSTMHELVGISSLGTNYLKFACKLSLAKIVSRKMATTFRRLQRACTRVLRRVTFSYKRSDSEAGQA